MKIRKVLLVDSDYASCELLKSILEQHFNLSIAESGKEAMEYLSQNSNLINAVIISDSLSGDDSNIGCYELLEAIHAVSQLRNIPVLVTGNSPDGEFEAMSKGANDFIHAPFDPEIVKFRVKNVINLHETALLAHTVSRDEVTGLYTKQYFLLRAAEILESNTEKKLYDFVCIDIEHFKLVNDSFGIEASNRILRHVADVLKESVSSKGGLVGHFSEDIFFVLMERPEEYTNESVGGWFDKVNDFPENKEKNVNLKLCCGIYHIHSMKVPLSVMCDRAQMATEKIKGRYGVSFCIYDDSIRKQLLSDQQIIDSMESALSNKEFEVYYQPKYELVNETIAGAEALVRWNNPNLGFIPPGNFIPIFEKNGFITQLDMFVWETVCIDLHEWMAAGHQPVAISINVSRADIYNPNLVNHLVSLIEKYQIPAKYLHLEITESAYSDAPEQIIKVVNELRKYDFPIEMDDFGSGYSSLNMLSEMPIDILKLDMGFVKNEMTRTTGKGILSFIIGLAKWLDLAVVAEGVETKAQISALKNMECNYVQGYYFAKPLCKKDFFERLTHEKISEMVCSNSAQLAGATIEKTVIARRKKTEEYVAGTMLIVDDVEASRAILTQIFKNQFDIKSVENGLEAWNYLKAHAGEVSVIMLDLVMPVMDGYELLSRVRTDKNMQLIPIIVTSQNDGDSEQRVLKMDADDFISKPYNPEILRYRVRNVIAHSKIKRLEQEYAFTQRMLEVERQAHTDFLTGLNNRTVLEKNISDFFVKSEVLDSVFITLDIDDFKLINDTIGHQTGDETIRRVAKILSEFFTKTDVICRMGGDEFSIFIPHGMTENELHEMLTDLGKRLNIKVEDRFVTCSMGVAVSPQFGIDYQTLYQNADMALLSAKRYGKNQYHIFNGQSVLPSYVFYRNMDWLLDEFNDAVYVCYADTYDLFYINKAACRIAGKDKKDCIGEKCYRVLWNRNSPCDFCEKNCIMGKDFVEKEIAPHSSYSSYKMRSKLVNWNGSEARLQYLIDTTMTTSMMKELRSISSEFTHLVDVIPGGVLKCSLDTEDYSFDFVNNNFVSSLGYIAEEFKNKFGNSFKKMLWKEDRDSVIQDIKVQLESSSVIHINFRVENKDGGLRSFSASAHSVFSPDGRNWLYITALRTDWK